MIFEVRKGRSCDSIKSIQANLIEVQGRELVAAGKALKLSEGKSATCGEMVDNLKEQVQIERKLSVNQQKQSKAKIRKLTLGIIVETIVIGLLLL